MAVNQALCDILGILMNVSDVFYDVFAGFSDPDQLAERIYDDFLRYNSHKIRTFLCRGLIFGGKRIVKLCCLVFTSGRIGVFISKVTVTAVCVRISYETYHKYHF